MIENPLLSFDTRTGPTTPDYTLSSCVTLDTSDPSLTSIRDLEKKIAAEVIISSETTVIWSSLREALECISRLPGYRAMDLLKHYAGDDAELLAQIADPRELVALALYVEECGGYGKPALCAVVDEETGELQFAALVLPDCDWEEWKRLARRVKEEMRRAGLEDLAPKVAVVCLRGLLEPTR